MAAWINWGVSEWMHDEKKPGDVLKVPGDALDDVADDVRYGIYTFITSADKPRELIIRELVQPLAQQGDLTSAYIRYLQHTEEERLPASPIRLGRRSVFRNWTRRW